MEVKVIFDELKNNSGRIEKERILKENKNNELFKEVLQFVYNPYIVTGLSSKKISKVVDKNNDGNINSIGKLMSYLQKNNTGTDRDISEVQRFITLSNGADMQYFLADIATKSLKCGITAKTINKIFGKGFIPTFDVMLAKKYQDHQNKVKGDFIITTKLDGIRCVAIKESNSVKLFTRQGQQIDGLVDVEQ